MNDIDRMEVEKATHLVQPRKGESSRFKVLKTLGAGGMGEVHLAEDLSLRRNVAIKSIRTQLCQDPDVLKRIERECLLHAKIGTHPHIVTLYDRLEEDGHIQLVMEYVEGETLYSLLDRLSKENKRLSLTQGIAIAVQTLEALARIHAHGIVHRDIKPANIMISHDDCGEYCAKLMDFGIARANDDGMTALTQTGMGGPGTPLYMAPEQIDPKVFGEISPATDVYAMGIMLYQIISGQPPFTGSITEIFNGHLNARPHRLDAKANPHVPGPIADIIEKALAKRQENRFTSAAAFREALLSYNTELSGATSTSHRPPEYRVQEAAPGAPATLHANDPALMAGVAAGQTMLHGGGTRTRTGNSGSRVAVVATAVVAVIAVAGAAGFMLLGKSDGETPTTSAAGDVAAPVSETTDAPAVQNAGMPGVTGTLQGGADATTVSVDVTTQGPGPSAVPVPTSLPNVDQGVQAMPDVDLSNPPQSLPPAIDGSATTATAPVNPVGGTAAPSQPQESATALFDSLRSKTLAEEPEPVADPEPVKTVPAAASEPPAVSEPPKAAAPAEPKPAPSKPKASSKPPAGATSIVADNPAPKADPPVVKADPPKPSGGGFKVVGKETTHTKQ